MANTVFIFGAGASQNAGVPLMGNFLDTARDLFVQGSVGEYEKNFKAVFQGISKLQLVHSKSQLNINNVETVFTAFEMAKTLGRFSDYSVDEIDFLVKSMKSLIVSTIQQTFSIPYSNSARQISAPSPYSEFLDHIATIKQDKNKIQSIAIITFNYDVAFDLAFHMANIPIYYGLEDNKIPNSIPLIKLHGSLNWAQCDECGVVVPWHLSDYFKIYNWNTHLFDSELGDRSLKMEIGSHIKDFKHGDHLVMDEPVIVPPSWNKSEYHSALSKVWSLAAVHLSEAENIIVIGYSLPPADAFFRLLYAIGTIGDTPLRRFWVINPDDSGDLENRFKQLLGPGAIQRFKYINKYFATSFSAIDEIISSYR